MPTDIDTQRHNAPLDDLVLENESGPRSPGGFAASLMLVVAVLWALFHLWVSSPLPYTSFFALELGVPVLSNSYQRYFHLSFALILAFLAYPRGKRSPRSYIPVYDWLAAGASLICVMYLYIAYAFYPQETQSRMGIPNMPDLVVSVIGVLLLLEAARRALGPPIVVIAVLFLLYAAFGNMPFIPDLIMHKGQSLEKLSSHMWISYEGVFGVALGVSNNFVFLFVLFGALLEKAGAGGYFIRLAFSLLGHLRGGPAKAAVVSSAMTGLISGSSIANVVTTGTFTVPLMRKVGFSREKAGAVEVSSSVNGQIMPPVMGAAAFLMAEFTGLPYVDIVKHAFIPAAISYIALIYIVHLEAVKADMTLLKRATRVPLYRSIITFLIVTSGIILFSGVTYVSVSWLKDVYGAKAGLFFAGVLATVYTGLVWYASRSPEDYKDPGESEFLPEPGPTAKAGLYYLLPIVILVWCLMIERFSPGLSAFWASAAMIVILVTQRPLMRFFREYGSLNRFTFKILPIAAFAPALLMLGLSGLHYALHGKTEAPVWQWLNLLLWPVFIYGITLLFGICAACVLLRKQERLEHVWFDVKRGLVELLDGMVTGSRNMTAIAVATAAAGIIVGSVSLTGIGQVLTEVVETLSGGSFLLALLFTAILCLILGMGLPTTANYIIVSTLMAGVLTELAAQSGIILPLIAAHMFVFYFGIMADVTPPVGLASFAAAAVSGGDPLRTGIQAFAYSIRTVLLPFLFVYNTNLLLIGDIDTAEAIWVFVKCTFALLLFTAATQGYMLTHNKRYETALMLLISFSLFYPQFWVNLITPAYEKVEPARFSGVLADLREGEMMKAEINGFDDIGDPHSFFIFVKPQEGKTPEEKMRRYGVTLRVEGKRVFVAGTSFFSPAAKAGLSFDAEIIRLYAPQPQMHKIWVYLVTFAAFFLLARSQRRRASVIYKEPVMALPAA